MNEKVKTIPHPMEDILDIESNSTELIVTERNTDLVIAEEYDDKDTEIEGQIQEVYDAAMSAFEDQMGEAEVVEGRYKARNGEVAVQFLNAALAATKEKLNLKTHKDKIEVSKGKNGPKTLNQNLIVADRNDLLKNIFKEINEPEPIETEPIEPEE